MMEFFSSSSRTMSDLSQNDSEMKSLPLIILKCNIDDNVQNFIGDSRNLYLIRK